MYGQVHKTRIQARTPALECHQGQAVPVGNGPPSSRSQTDNAFNPGRPRTTLKQELVLNTCSTGGYVAFDDAGGACSPELDVIEMISDPLNQLGITYGDRR